MKKVVVILPSVRRDGHGPGSKGTSHFRRSDKGAQCRGLSFHFGAGRTGARRETGLTPGDYSVIRRNGSVQFPHFPEREGRLVKFRMFQVDLNVIKRELITFDLGDLIPTIVLMPPAILIP